MTIDAPPATTPVEQATVGAAGSMLSGSRVSLADPGGRAELPQRHAVEPALAEQAFGDAHDRLLRRGATST